MRFRKGIQHSRITWERQAHTRILSLHKHDIHVSAHMWSSFVTGIHMSWLMKNSSSDSVFKVCVILTCSTTQRKHRQLSKSK